MARYIISLVALCAIVPAITAKSVTYPGIGTFDSNDFFDIVHRPTTEAFLPQSPEHIDPQFLLYTRKNHDNEDHIKWNNTESINASHFDASKNTKFIVHGFIDNQLFGEWMRKMKNAFLAFEDVNVILVDWHKGNFFPYGQGTVNTRVVGAMVGIQIQALNKAKGGTPDTFHILGHSLGSHIAGYAGKWLKGELGRITGLDPAGPYFEGLKPEARLWHTDAKFVDSIHTDARPLLPEIGFGMYETCSHVDIYPNGGKAQPGCDEERLTAAFFSGIAEGARRLVACNHQRAVDFFIDSLDTTLPLPKAYECHDFDDFKQGKCTECGANGEKCVILGPRDPEYKNSGVDINKGQETTNGKRFFMITGQHEPLLSKFQYILHIHMASEGLEHFDKLAHVHIKFVDKKGHEESFPFNDEANVLEAIFRIGQSYTHPGVLAMDPADVAKVDFEWDHANPLDKLDLLHLEKMHVDRLEIVGLTSSTSSTKTPAASLTFCNKNSGIGVLQHFSFEKC